MWTLSQCGPEIIVSAVDTIFYSCYPHENARNPFVPISNVSSSSSWCLARGALSREHVSHRPSVCLSVPESSRQDVWGVQGPWELRPDLQVSTVDRPGPGPGSWTWSRVLDLVPGPGPGPGSWTWSRVLDLVPGPSCVMQMLKRPVGGTSLPRVGAVGVSHCDW